MSLWCLLVLLALPDPTVSTNPGVKVQITQQGLDYGRQIGIAYLQEKLKSVNIPDISGSEKVSPIGKVEYRLSGMRITNLGLPQSSLGLVPGTGISLSIGNAFINLHGDWHVKYLKIIKDSGSFDLAVSGLTIKATIGVGSDETGRPTVSSNDCTASVGGVSVTFHGGGSWLYNLFTSFIEKQLRKSLEQQICPLVHDGISDLNPHLKTLNVLATVDKYAEIEYSMVTPPSISNFLIELSLKGEFYNIGQHQDPPFSAPPFSLPPQNSSMLYIGLSSFTANSAGFVYNRAGALSLYITDDMVPSSSPIRLNTKTFGAFVPEISKRFPDMMMKLLVKTSTQPNVTFEPNNMTLQAMGTLTAYAILPNTTLEPLFILNMDASVSGNFYISGLKLAGSLQLNGFDMALGTSYVGEFQVKPLYNIFMLVMKLAVIPKVNEYLQQGFPLPAIGRMNLINSKLQVQKDYMLIGTDVHFTQ
ncbi:bactericidal permeability-increasing protein-like isoform X3 [Brienomyrus brachyistius]|uniref:bactericidal permeability-increasing protein-like isoform X2 n=1 Tax=Brienomyrus brachyistius TaxID=42636 RepID=UPI0020B3E034|nr:bactericidal permeability-increasing protein-like isoform X2 [Brienomyrus brachyistius]XP_048878335.1 bactericidal permeability-increasing protein-like isoform X3 [Brienomyrus brachyistius]